MPARPFRGVLLAAFLLAPFAAPAAAAQYNIGIGPGNTYSPSMQQVAPGDIVQWAANTTHPLRFDGEDSEYTSAYTRTLSTPGALRFYCAEHGGPGGTGMSGVITVVNAPPGITLTRETASPVAGQPVTFRATASDPDGQSVRIDWDLDGDRTFERIDAGATVAASFGAGSHTVTARAVDPAGANAQASVTFTVPGGSGPGGAGPGAGPGADTAGPAVRGVKVASAIAVRTLRRRGVRVRLTPSEDGTLAATLRDTRGRRLGRATTPVRAGERATLRVRARRAHPGRHKLRLTVTDRAGNRTTVRRTLRVTG